MKALAVAITCIAIVGNATADERRPNVIVIFPDDLGYADVGFQGCRDIPTPYIDRLAAAGVRFTNGYVTHSYCSPSRAGLLSGRYQQRFGHECNLPYLPDDQRIGLPTEEVLLPAALQKAGYVTGIIGKWHVGAAEPFRPLQRGFDEFFGFLGGGHDYFREESGISAAEYVVPLMRGGAPAQRRVRFRAGSVENPQSKCVGGVPDRDSGVACPV